MAKLSNEIKTFIVQQLAMFQTPSQVAELVKEDFGIEVSRQQVHEYDPTRSGDKPAKKWCALFEAMRIKWLADQSEIGIAQLSYRLQELDRMYRAALRRKNYPLAAQLLEQAAKESQGHYAPKKKGATGEKDDPVHMAFFMPEVPPPVGADNRRADDDE